MSMGAHGIARDRGAVAARPRVGALTSPRTRRPRLDEQISSRGEWPRVPPRSDKRALFYGGSMSPTQLHRAADGRAAGHPRDYVADRFAPAARKRGGGDFTTFRERGPGLTVVMGEWRQGTDAPRSRYRPLPRGRERAQRAATEARLLTTRCAPARRRRFCTVDAHTGALRPGHGICGWGTPPPLLVRSHGKWSPWDAGSLIGILRTGHRDHSASLSRDALVYTRWRKRRRRGPCEPAAAARARRRRHSGRVEKPRPLQMATRGDVAVWFCA